MKTDMKNKGFAAGWCLFLLMLFSGISCLAEGPDETAKLVAAGLQSGNAPEVTKYFNAMVDLSLPGSDDTYSKVQAGQILRQFFEKNPVKGFRISKQGSSADGSTYCIGTLEAGKKTYRVYYLIKLSGGLNLIHQLQIQEN